jgi:RNA polymerase sigma-70 factor (ECF subfamily)
MNVTLAQMSLSLTPSPAQAMADASIEAETTSLARQAQAGNDAAFGALIDLHERAARRVAAAALGNAAEADEAVQDACITAWQRIHHLEDPGAFRAWLLRITWRKALDRRRSLKAWLKRIVSPASTAGSAKLDAPVDVANIADGAATADAELLNKERDQQVAQMIRSLPPRLRDPFLLAASGEHRYEEIAVILRIPVGTVKWRVSEARRVLRDKLTRAGIGR